MKRRKDQEIQIHGRRPPGCHPSPIRLSHGRGQKPGKQTHTPMTAISKGSKPLAPLIRFLSHGQEGEMRHRAPSLSSHHTNRSSGGVSRAYTNLSCHRLGIKFLSMRDSTVSQSAARDWSSETKWAWPRPWIIPDASGFRAKSVEWAVHLPFWRPTLSRLESPGAP